MKSTAQSACVLELRTVSGVDYCREQNQFLDFIALTFEQADPGCEQISMRGQSRKVGKEHYLMLEFRGVLCQGTHRDQNVVRGQAMQMSECGVFHTDGPETGVLLGV